MNKKINLATWNRREHFEFYRQFDDPFFGIVVDLDCTKLYHSVKKSGESFFLHYLHKTLQTINDLDEFRYRIVGNDVICYDKIHVSSTIGREDNTFAFTFIEYDENFESFKNSAKKEIYEVQNSSGLRISENSERNDTIHFTAIPWLKFSSISHPKNLKFKDSIPKIAFGKMLTNDNKKIIPVSLHAHHGLLDGYHAGLFFDYLQNMLNI